MHWPGPIKGGVTQSLISKFLECPYCFYLYAGLGLEEPGEIEPNLMWGDTAHVGLEHIIRKNHCIIDFTAGDWEEIDDIVEQHLHTNYPKAPDTFLHSIQHMLRLYDDSFKEEYGPFETEQNIEQDYTTGLGRKCTLRGKKDAINHDNTVLGEHKFKGRVEPAQIKPELYRDLQLGIYCHASGATKVIYDVIKIPDTQWGLPYRRGRQRPHSYVKELYYEKQGQQTPIANKRHLWLFQEHIPMPTEAVQEILQFTVDPIIERIWKWYEHVSQPDFDPDNPKFYNEVFYRTPVRHFDPATTQTYKPSYYNYRTGVYDLEDLTKVKSYYPELEEGPTT
jgi:hypothetical protein